RPSHAVLRPRPTALARRGRRPDLRLDLAGPLFHALQPRRLPEGPPPQPQAGRHRFSRRLHPGARGPELDRAAQAGEVAVKSLANIFWLGLKEIRSLLSDADMVVFVIYAFTWAIKIQATGTQSEVTHASCAAVD